MVITSLQLVQMIIGCVVNYMAFNYKQNGQFHHNRNKMQHFYKIFLLAGLQCGVSDTNLKLSLLMYCSYFVLFARFFYNAYVNKCERKQLSDRLQDEDKKIIQEKSEATKKAD